MLPAESRAVDKCTGSILSSHWLFITYFLSEYFTLHIVYRSNKHYILYTRVLYIIYYIPGIILFILYTRVLSITYCLPEYYTLHIVYQSIIHYTLLPRVLHITYCCPEYSWEQFRLLSLPINSDMDIKTLWELPPLSA